MIFEVLKLDKFKLIISLHSWNIQHILVAKFVIKLFFPFISFNFLKLLNIKIISITLDTSKFILLIEYNCIHFSNNPFKLVIYFLNINLKNIIPISLKLYLFLFIIISLFIYIY